MPGKIYSDVYIALEKPFNVNYIYRQKEVIRTYFPSFKSLLYLLSIVQEPFVRPGRVPQFLNSV
jgi:hypothetical protein